MAFPGVLMAKCFDIFPSLRRFWSNRHDQTCSLTLQLRELEHFVGVVRLAESARLPIRLRLHHLAKGHGSRSVSRHSDSLRAVPLTSCSGRDLYG